MADPVRFDDCDLPDLDLGGGRRLDGIHRADLFGPRQETELKRLVTAVSRILDHPQALAAESVVAVGPAYLQQVRQIAPPGFLLGQEAELAELTAFCTELDHGSYA